jgi:OOP family OmpA-OmpF porin
MTSRFVRILGLAAPGLACLSLACLPWQSAAAAELGVYAGVSYAQVNNGVKQSDFDAAGFNILAGEGFVPDAAAVSFDNKGPGYNFVVGYRLFPWLAVEGGYMDMGKVSHRIVSDGTQFDAPANANLSINAKSSGITVSALGILPLSYRWEVYGRAGAVFATNRLSLFITDSLGQGSGQTSGSKTNFLAGAGVSMSLAEVYGVRLEYQRIFAVEAEQIGEGDVDFLTLGVTVQF